MFRTLKLSMAAIVAAVSIAMIATATPAAGSTDATYSDGAVIEAVAFQTGPAASAVGTDLADVLPPSQLRLYRSQALRLIDGAEARGHLDGIVADIRSGNPAVVERALRSLSDELVASAEAEYGADVVREALRDQQAVGGYGACSFAVVCVAYAAAAVHNTVAVTALAVAAAGGVIAPAAAVWKGKWFWSAASGADGSSLTQDRYIADITAAFAA